MTSDPSGRPLWFPAETWRETLAAVPAVDLTAVRGVDPGARLLLVSAHPDDETIGAGRLAADWAAQVGPVAAVTLSAGEACFDVHGPRPDGIGERRLDEWRAALAELGAEPLGCSHLPDGRLGEHEEQVHEVLATLAAACDVVAAPWARDPHPDHMAVGRVAARAAQERGIPLVAYPVWATYRLAPGEIDAPLARVRTSPEAEAARTAALAQYPTQLEPPAPGLPPVVTAALLDHHGAQLLVGETL